MKKLHFIIILLLLCSIVYAKPVIIPSKIKYINTNNDYSVVSLSLKNNNLYFDNSGFKSDFDNKLRINKISFLKSSNVKTFDRYGEILYRNDNFIILNISSDKLNDLYNNPNINAIGLNSNRFVPFINPLLSISIPVINATVFWDAGYKGGNVDVAIVDTGIMMNHSSLAVNDNSIIRTFESNNTMNLFSNDFSDNYGHGTHVSGIVSSSDFTYRGVAPGLVNLLNVKIFDPSATDSSAMLGLEWAVKFANDPAEVLSNSWGSSYKDSNNNCVITSSIPDGNDIMTLFVDDIASSYPVSVVFAAGNDGVCGSNSMAVPGDAFNILTVGSINDRATIDRSDDIVSDFSSRGPTLDGRKKPDIVTSGTGIVSTWNDGSFAAASGTSMAAPHVSGAAALLTEYGLSPLQIKTLLINTADDYSINGWDQDYGWGSLNLGNAFLKANYTIQSTIPRNSSKFYRIYNVSNNDKFTLAWYRHILNNNLLNDIDLYLYNEFSNKIVNSSVSSVDNVEQVVSDSFLDSAIIKITPFTYYNNLSSETFALSSYNNIYEVSSPSLNVSFSISNTNINDSDTVLINANVFNNGSLILHNINLSLYSNILNFSTNFINNLSPNYISNVSWNFSYSNILSDNVLININLDSYGEIITFNSDNFVINVSDDDNTVPLISNITFDSNIFKTSSFSLNASIFDNSNIYSAVVYYDYNNNGIDGSINMSNINVFYNTSFIFFNNNLKNNLTSFFIEVFDNDSDRINDRSSVNTSLFYINILNNNVSIINYTLNNNFVINETDSVNFTNIHIDLDNDNLTYSWFLDNYLVSNNDNYTYTSNYSSSGLHNVTFFISDGLSSSSVSWNFSVNNVNRKPIANVGSDRTIIVNNSISLSGSLSNDPDNDNITYLWKQNSGPENLSINNLNNIQITFTPKTAGIYTIQLIVNDGNLNSDASILLLTVNNIASSSSTSSGGGGGGGGGNSNLNTDIITPVEIIKIPEKPIVPITKIVEEKQIEPIKDELKIEVNSPNPSGFESITSRTVSTIKNSGKYFVKFTDWIVKINIKTFVTIKNIFIKYGLFVKNLF